MPLCSDLSRTGDSFIVDDSCSSKISELLLVIFSLTKIGGLSTGTVEAEPESVVAPDTILLLLPYGSIL